MPSFEHIETKTLGISQNARISWTNLASHKQTFWSKKHSEKGTKDIEIFNVDLLDLHVKT